MKAKSVLPSCPVCKTAKQVVRQGVVGDLFLCRKCGGLFDCDVSEGGSHFDDPTKRIEVLEAEYAKGKNRPSR